MTPRLWKTSHSSVGYSIPYSVFQFLDFLSVSLVSTVSLLLSFFLKVTFLVYFVGNLSISIYASPEASPPITQRLLSSSANEPIRGWFLLSGTIARGLFPNVTLLEMLGAPPHSGSPPGPIQFSFIHNDDLERRQCYRPQRRRASSANE